MFSNVEMPPTRDWWGLGVGEGAQLIYGKRMQLMNRYRNLIVLTLAWLALNLGWLVELYLTNGLVRAAARNSAPYYLASSGTLQMERGISDGGWLLAMLLEPLLVHVAFAATFGLYTLWRWLRSGSKAQLGAHGTNARSRVQAVGMILLGGCAISLVLQMPMNYLRHIVAPFVVRGLHLELPMSLFGMRLLPMIVFAFAASAIHIHRRSSRALEGRCLHCGYLLSPSRGDRCSECGILK